MGRKKQKPDKSTQGEPKKSEKETKAQKSYSFAAPGVGGKPARDDDNLVKVALAPDREASIVSLIKGYKAEFAIRGKASLRLSTKKLTDVYTSLTQAGFSHAQIDQAMTSNIQYGGDLIDILDWLCLNTPNDQLPEGFSQTLCEEENRRRPWFVETEAGAAAARAASTTPARNHPNEAAVTSHNQAAQAASPKEEDKKAGMKSWILQYAAMSSDEEEDEDNGSGHREANADPNERYLALMANLLDARTQAADAKQDGDKASQKQASKLIRDYSHAMTKLEEHPDFQEAVKIQGVELEMAALSRPRKEKKPKAAETMENQEMMGCDTAGLAMFEEQAAAEKPKPAPKGGGKPLDKRSFEYTRQQWTGKSPKQFLIDWVRKHLPKSPPPSFEKVHVKGNLWRSKCKVMQRDSPLVVCPDIVCENVKEAEHLACMLALFRLCKGQRVYQLLPPPYRDVWLEWASEEEQAKQDSREQQNKPRDQLIARLMKKVKNSSVARETAAEEEEEDVEESWEDLLSEEEEEVPQEKSSHKKARPVLDPGLAQKVFTTRTKSAGYHKLLAKRRELPVFQHRAAILQDLHRHSVVVVSGETGSGKSTQIPQFILEDSLQNGYVNRVNIVCTEPRRISATSLASRVCQELGEGWPGSREAFCGYQIRFESRVGAWTRLTYCTTGVLLRRLQLDPALKDITHVIVDEVHERSVQSDFLLIVLRNLLLQRPELKVVLMSATADSEKFSAYFSYCPIIRIPGRTFPVQVLHLEDVVEQTGYVLEDDSPYAVRYDKLVEVGHTEMSVTGKGGSQSTLNVTWTKEDVSKLDQSGLDPSRYCVRTRNIVTRLNPDRINMELITEVLHWLETSPQYRSLEGAVLVFLPGLAHIQELHEMINTDARFQDQHRFQVVALHSVLSSDDQSLAFDIPPPGVRKIVIATNIAETGITIPDVVFVIDSGKVKENRYVEAREMSILEEVYVSQASARQRQGRAGRVREGFCLRLFTQDKFESMKAYSVPEILRVPLEELCLNIMKCELGVPAEFLGRALDAPAQTAITRAMDLLREIGACEVTAATLTPLGHHLAALPVNVRVGKMLVYGAIFGCLEPMAVIGAAMADKSPFAVPMGKRAEADEARQSLSTACSDHLTLYRAYLGWRTAAARSRGAEFDYCQRYFLKRTSLIDIQNVSSDLIKLVKSIGFELQPTAMKGLGSDPLSAKKLSILKAILTAGLYPNIARVQHTPKVDSAANPTREVCVAQTAQGQVQTHPASVNRFLGANGWLVYQEKVKLTQVYLRDSTLVGAVPILLFGGAISVQHREQVVAVDGWIKCKAYARTAVIFKELRGLLSDLLSRKLEDPSLNVSGEAMVQEILGLVTSAR